MVKFAFNMIKLNNILAIESSCDETASSVVQCGRVVLSNIIASQIPLHARYGGVVPEIAARAHTEAILTVIDQALTNAFGGNDRNAQMKQIDAVAVTVGPGLTGSLLVGVSTAKTLALCFDKPLIPVNHILGHVYSNYLQSEKSVAHISFPTLTLVASGGHTELILSRSHIDHKIISQTRDDAAGEAFDKVAALLKLPYPGGPSVSASATLGNATKYPLPRGLSKSDSLDFSFSGLKTAVAQLVKKLQNEGVNMAEATPHVAASFQLSVVDSLVTKTLQAAKKYKVNTIGLAGGVAANLALRHTLSLACQKENLTLLIPHLDYCTDNAAMIGAAAHAIMITKSDFKWYNAKVESNMSLGR